MSYWDRVKAKLNSKNISEAELGRRIGLSQSAINAWKSRGSIPSADVAYRTAKILDTTVEYLVSGNKLKIENDNSTNTFIVPVLNQQLSAGKGDFLPETDIIKGFLEIPKFLIQQYGNNLAAIFVHGDSMEPTLHNGDIVVATSLGWDSSEGLYAIRMNGSGYIKRLQIGNGKILVKSDNPKYETVQVDFQDEWFEVVGKIVFIGVIPE